ncbi:MAG: BON domain-containing protein [Burkholderiales bacterium]|nr:BON domain-containing protein [Rhodocyclaceae bacterium]
MKRLLMLAGLVASVVMLQGCFPIVAVGVGTTALVVDDRRSTGFYVEDENIEWKARSIIIDRFKDAHVNVTSFNLSVLLTGEVSDEKMKADIGEAIRKIGSVKNVTNELTVGGKSSLAARSNDTLITTNVKTRFLGAKGFSSNHVKIVTEASVVYLMGIVTKEEADAATEVARTTSGVSRVIRVFEYVDKAPTR